MFNKLIINKHLDFKSARRLLSIIRTSSSQFSTQNEKTSTPDAKSEEKVDPNKPNEKQPEPNNDKNEEAKANKPKEESKTQQEEHEEGEDYDRYENQGGFSFRRVMYVFGKAIKYSIWTYMALFSYHFYLVRKTEKPEQALGCISMFLNHAQRFNWSIEDLTLLLTRPPVEKLMPDKPPLPPHIPYPKTLIIGLRGVTVHSEYILGVGFEFKKRPGLSTFIQRMARYYEVVVFGDEESSLVQEI